MISTEFNNFSAEISLSKAQGGHSVHLHIEGGGSQSKEFSDNPKMSLHVHWNQEIFHTLNLVHKHKVSRNNANSSQDCLQRAQKYNSTMLGVEHGFSFIWTQKYHFWQYSDPKISDLPPCMCMF